MTEDEFRETKPESDELKQGLAKKENVKKKKGKKKSKKKRVHEDERREKQEPNQVVEREAQEDAVEEAYDELEEEYQQRLLENLCGLEIGPELLESEVSSFSSVSEPSGLPESSESIVVDGDIEWILSKRKGDFESLSGLIQASEALVRRFDNFQSVIQDEVHTDKECWNKLSGSEMFKKSTQDARRSALEAKWKRELDMEDKVQMAEMRIQHLEHKLRRIESRANKDAILWKQEWDPTESPSKTFQPPLAPFRRAVIKPDIFSDSTSSRIHVSAFENLPEEGVFYLKVSAKKSIGKTAAKLPSKVLVALVVAKKDLPEEKEAKKLLEQEAEHLQSFLVTQRTVIERVTQEWESSLPFRDFSFEQPHEFLANICTEIPRAARERVERTIASIRRTAKALAAHPSFAMNTDELRALYQWCCENNVEFSSLSLKIANARDALVKM